MNINFLYRTEFSVTGTLEPVLCGIEIEGTTIAFTGACTEAENFDFNAEEMALFAGDAESVHFERARVYVPVRGRGLNDKGLTEEISMLTVRAIAHGEVVNMAQVSRVVSRYQLVNGLNLNLN